MIGARYGNTHTSDLDLVFKSVDRPILPPLRKREKVIYSKHGAWDYGGNTFDKRIIVGELKYVGTSFAELRSRARQIAAWLSGYNGLQQLIFDDEPDKYYMAKVYEQTSLSNLFTIGNCEVRFECQPMANYIVTTAQEITWESTELTWDTDITWNNAESFSFSVTSSPTLIEFDNFGTMETGLNSQPGSTFTIAVAGSFTNLSISMNGSTINYTEAINSETVVFDNVNGTIKKGGTNKEYVCSGDTLKYFKVVPGTNEVTVTGTGLNCEITFDFRPQYV